MLQSLWHLYASLQLILMWSNVAPLNVPTASFQRICMSSILKEWSMIQESGICSNLYVLMSQLSVCGEVRLQDRSPTNYCTIAVPFFLDSNPATHCTVAQLVIVPTGLETGGILVKASQHKHDY
jgi:hypothetical protein